MAELRTLTDWLRAAPGERASALPTCLARIRERDTAIRAWVQVQADAPSRREGPLAGIPFGAKDVLETVGLATEYGSPVYRGRLGSTDAAIVTALRERGAVLAGKTQCAAFAYRTPPPTHNPRCPDRTPGGSSSGSAAAVAADMVPFTIGTQTLGSVLRPASFCGVTGFKPSYGLLPLDGVFPVAPSLDTLGFFTHTADDMLALWRALGQPMDRIQGDLAFGVVDPLPSVEPSMGAAFTAAVDALRRSGLTVRPVDLAEDLDRLGAAAGSVMAFEAARAHRARYDEHGDRLEDLADLIRTGLAMASSQYDNARRTIADAAARVAAWHRETPVILVPAAPGPAPLGLQSTGDARMNAPWTALGTPALSIPMLPVDGLPLGLQLTAARGADGRLLQAAVRAAALIADAHVR